MTAGPAARSPEVDAYIVRFEGVARERLERMRELVTEEAPDAVERIAYGMPAYQLAGKPLVYFAGYAKHTGFYATPNGHEEFAAEFARFTQGRGSVQFPHTEPLPEDLVRRVVRFRAAHPTGGRGANEVSVSRPRTSSDQPSGG